VTADEIYDIVHKMAEQKKPQPPSSQFGPGRLVDDKQPGQGNGEGNGDGQGDGQGQGEGDQPGQGQSPQSDERFWEEIMAQANSMGRGNGSFQSIAKVLKPRERKQRWDRLIRGFANRAIARGGRDLQTFSRTSRRSGDIILPGWMSQKPSIACIIDSSGSVSDEMLRAALTEVTALAKLASVRIFLAIHDGVCYWHGWVKAETTVEELSRLAGRRGGTDPRQAFERVGEAKGRFDALVYLTDGEVGQYPDKPLNVKHVCVALSRMSSYKTPTPDGWQEVPIEVDTSRLGE
jgi:predicted metal-dependent peptidase